jgi:hypothetical protein
MKIMGKIENVNPALQGGFSVPFLLGLTRNCQPSKCRQTGLVFNILPLFDPDLQGKPLFCFPTAKLCEGKFQKLQLFIEQSLPFRVETDVLLMPLLTEKGFPCSCLVQKGHLFDKDS